MDDTKFMKDQLIHENKNLLNNLINKSMPSISLPNQEGNLLQLKRNDSFRLIIYFYSLTGNPKKKLPKNWNIIPGAKGCTLENCCFRDNYEKFIQMNALPIGISTQTIDEIKEMTNRLGIQYDILSDSNLFCARKLSLPTFSIDQRTFIRRLTIIVEKNIIKKVFYPIDSIHKHIDSIIKWLK
tara:strand:- start:3178 stop:3726 length:549 start_codon:yes stop_codon:yes gene_type:complete